MVAGTAELVDREAETKRVGSWLDGRLYGRGGLLVIEGEAGVGKTALVEVGVAAARAAGVRVLAARGSELEQGFAFGVVRQALERAVAGRDDLFAGGAGLARLVLREPSAAGGETAREGALHGLYWLLSALADPTPVLFVVDDLHWADEDSVAFLRFLTLRLEGLPLAVLAATRPAVAEDAVAALIADPGVEVIRPPALSVPGTARVLELGFARQPSPEFAAAAHRATGGNPFLLEQLVHAAIAERIEPDAAQAERLVELRPQGLARTVLVRVHERDRALARAAAILGDHAPIGLAAELAGLSGAAAEASADALAAAGVLRDERPLRFRHPLLQGAVLAGMPAGEQARLHAEAVRVLRELGDTPERIAAHLLRISPGADPGAVVTLRAAAADAIARGAPASASPLLRRALEERLEGAERAEILMALGVSEHILGRPSAADHFILAAGVTDDRRRSIEAAIAACAASPLDPERGARAVELIEALDVGTDDRQLALRALNARLHATWSDIKRYHEIARDANALAPVTGETEAECLLLAHLARVSLESGGTAAEVADLAERASAAHAYEEPGWFIAVMIALLATDNYDSAERIVQPAVERAQARGARRDYMFAMGWSARVAWQRGDLLEAEGRARAALGASEGAREWWRFVPTSILIETLLEQGRLPDAQAAWAETGLGEKLPPLRPMTPLLGARGRLRLAEGAPAAALADLLDARTRLGHAGFERSVNGITTRLSIVEALHALGRTDDTRAESLSAVQLTRHFGAPLTLGAALRVHGRVNADDDALLEAVELLRDAPARLEYAKALVDLGAAMRRRRERRESREPLREGHDLAIACAAHPLAELARTELAASGVHVTRRDPSLPETLTPSERRIAGLAAGGASNREIAQSVFLTVKTVEMHLSNAYRKLDIRSRRDLPPALADPSADNPA